MNPDEAQVDDLLVQRMRRGDSVAFAALATRYWNAVHRIGWNMLPDPSAAGGLAESTLLSALRSAGKRSREVPFRTSLYRQAMSEALVRIHSGSSRSQSGETAFGAGDAADRIRATLQQLDSLDRAAFVLRVIEQLSVDEAAAVLEISPESIRQRAHRASLILTGFLGDLCEPSSRESLS